MATIKEYYNKYGSEISFQQLQDIKEYIEIIKNNNLIKEEKIFKGNNLEFVSYHKENTEQLADILSKYPNNITVNIKTHFETYGIYKMVYESNYFNQILSYKGRYLMNTDGNIILFQDLDINTDNPIPGTTTKYFYYGKEEYYTFEYDETGQLINMNSNYHKNAGCWNPDDLNDLDGFSWAQVGNYYQNADPVVPQ